MCEGRVDSETPSVERTCEVRTYLRDTTTQVTPPTDNGIGTTNHVLGKHAVHPILTHKEDKRKAKGERGKFYESNSADDSVRVFILEEVYISQLYLTHDKAAPDDTNEETHHTQALERCDGTNQKCRNRSED